MRRLTWSLGLPLAVLYQKHVREARQLTRDLRRAESRAQKAEAQHADDLVRIESWNTMAAALETGGDEQQRKVAIMGRRLTQLRVRELTLSRQGAAQLAELTGLRSSWVARENDARASAVESSAALARSEREKRAVEGRLAVAMRKLAVSSPREDLEAERAKLVALQRAYRSAHEQAARCAGAESEAVQKREETTLLREQLGLVEAQVEASRKAARDAQAALLSLPDKARSGGTSSTALLQLEAQLQHSQIAEASAASRAEAAERILADAQRSRRELAERLQDAELPAVEQRESLRQLEEELAATKQQLAVFTQDTEFGARQKTIQALEQELKTAKEEAHRAKDLEPVAVMTATELGDRHALQETEATALREMVSALQQASDEGVELGKMQWAMLQARRSEGECRRREAVAQARFHHTQAQLFRLQLATEKCEAERDEALEAAQQARAERSRTLAELAQQEQTSVPLSVLEARSAQIQDNARKAADAQQAVAALRLELEAAQTGLAALAARGEDQQALLRTVLTEAQRRSNSHLLEPAPGKTGASSTVARDAGPAAAAAAAAADADADADADGAVEAKAMVTLLQLSEEKTSLKVSELRLQRRVHSLELSELRERETAKEATVARERLEEALVRAEESAAQASRQSAARMAELEREVAQQRLRLQQPMPMPPSAVGASAIAAAPTAGQAPAAAATPAKATTPAKPAVTRTGGPRTARGSPSGKADSKADGRGSGLGGSGGATPVKDGFEVLEAQAELAEATKQLRALEEDKAALELAVSELQADLSAARGELLEEESAVARKDQLIKELQQARSSDSKASLQQSESSASELATQAATDEARHARTLSLAQETVISLQQQLRRKDEEVVKYQEMLAAAREATRKEKASAAADSERMTERLYQQHEQGITQLQQALVKLDATPEPRASGADMTMAELEEILDEKDQLVQRLQMELETSQRDLKASRHHLQERVGELETVQAQLEQQKKAAPTHSMQQLVLQLRTQVKTKERELAKMKDVIGQLKEDMDLVAAENAERQSRAAAAAKRTEEKAKAERTADQALGERMVRLQERLQGYQTEVRGLKQKETTAQKHAAAAAQQLEQAEALTARQSGEIHRLQSELSTLKALQQEWSDKEQLLKRQLSSRTQQLETFERAPVHPRPPTASSMERRRDQQVAEVADAVARAVAAERARWQSVEAAVGEAMGSFHADERQRAILAAQKAQQETAVAEAERQREVALVEAAKLRSALRQAEDDLEQMQHDAAEGRRAAAEQGRPATAEGRSREGGGDGRRALEARAVGVNTSFGGGSPPRASVSAANAGASAANAAAVERWEAEKRLQKRLEVTKAKLSEKGRELATAEAELAKSRSQLEESTRREAAMKEAMVAAQEQLARMQRERESVASHALSEMRSREEMSGSLYTAQRALAAATAELSRHRTAAAAAAPPPASASDVLSPDALASAGTDELRVMLHQKDQQALEQAFTIEQHELTISQLQARLRDLTAYQSVLAAVNGSAERGSPPRPTGGGATGSARARGGGGSAAAAAGPSNKEELSAVVERMTRVVQRLQAENAALQKKAVSNVKYVEVQRESRELRGQLEALQKQLAEANSRAAGLREEADRSARLMREVALVKDARKVEAERAAGLRAKLTEALRAQSDAEAAAEAAQHQPAQEAQAVMANRELEQRVARLTREARSAAEETAAARQETLQYGTRLRDALRDADETRSRMTELIAEVEVLREAQQAAAKRGDELEVQLRGVGGGTANVATSGPVSILELQHENEALRQENREMSEELAAITPEFFDEIDRLRASHAQAQAQLQAYGQRYGML